ncbi:hypothetical protein ISS30_09185 [bacterium]|nr:hypothetical protein [FCB group bacterium]MBL7191859.1 hypothetical protein [bacterium]
MRRLFHILAAVISIALILSSCSEEDSGILEEQYNPPQVESISIPENMAFGLDEYKIFRVIITGEAQGSEVFCTIISGGQSAADFQLYDDAGYNVIVDYPEYLSENSGDVVANDGIFTRRVNSLFADNNAVYDVVFTVVDANSDTIYYNDNSPLTINVYENAPPSLTIPNLPAVLDSTTLPHSLQTTVIDPQGREDIDSVYCELFQNLLPIGRTFSLQDPEMDSIFTYYIDSTFAAGLSGDYQFVFKAVDILGAVSPPIEMTASIANYSPYLNNPAISPDSIIILPEIGEITEVVITVSAGDYQGLGDIDTVTMDIERPSGLMSYDYPMADNGLPFDTTKLLLGYYGDETAGDGVFTTTKLYNNQAETGFHTFYIKAVDKVGNEAEPVSVILEIIQE